MNVYKISLVSSIHGKHWGLAFYVKTKSSSESHMECIFGNVGIYIVILDSCFVMFGR